MQQRLLIVSAILLIYLSSCNSILSNRQSMEEPVLPEMTQTRSAIYEVEDTASETSTPLKPDNPTTQSPTESLTPDFPTITLTPRVTVTPEGPSQTPTLTLTRMLVLRPTATQALFGSQAGSPIGIPNFAHPDLGCSWMGLAGQVFDFDDVPMEELVIEVGGTLAGQPVFGLAITGQAEAYGPGGYEVKLGDEPISSSGTAWAQIFDLNGNEISSPIYFSTYSECEKNLILLNFAQAYRPPSEWIYLPIIVKN